MANLKDSERIRHWLTYDGPDLPALIELYEANYARLLQLVPELTTLPKGTLVSRVYNATDLYLTVVEKQRYTTKVNLSYRFENNGKCSREPNASIYIYNDVKSVALIGTVGRRKYIKPHWRLRRIRFSDLDLKYRTNRFLYRWMGFCIRQGHLFLSSQNQPTNVSSSQKEA